MRLMFCKWHFWFSSVLLIIQNYKIQYIYLCNITFIWINTTLFTCFFFKYIHCVNTFKGNDILFILPNFYSQMPHTHNIIGKKFLLISTHRNILTYFQINFFKNCGTFKHFSIFGYLFSKTVIDSVIIISYFI